MAMENKSSSNLRIGDVILLYCSIGEENGHEKNGGYIMADFSGFISEQLLTVQKEMNESDDQPVNIEMSAFMVRPANKYFAQSQYTALQRELKGQQERGISDKPTMDFLELQIVNAQRDSEVERDENNYREAELLGSTVQYGDDVQLQHILTKKYIQVTCVMTSLTENSRPMVHLQDEDDTACIFRLIPYKKVEILGSDVHYADQMKLENVGFENYFLHCSEISFNEANINVFSRERYEINVSTKGTPFRMKYFRHEEVQHSASYTFVKNNGLACIFHRTHQSYLKAEGSFGKNCVVSPGMKTSKERIADEGEEVLEPEHLETATSSLLHQRRKIWVEAEMHEVAVDSEPPTSALPSKNSDVLLPPELFQGIERSLRELSIDYGSYVEDNISAIKNVYFKRKKWLGSIGTCSLLAPSYFWKIVKNTCQYGGEPLLWNEECRIMHLPTRRYLSVTGSEPNFEVKLVNIDSENAGTAVFKLLPAVKKISKEVPFQTDMRIKHRDTDTWLYMIKDWEYKSSTANLPTGVRSVVNDLSQIGATHEINPTDVFIMGQVDDSIFAEFNRFTDITTLLANQVNKCLNLKGTFHSHLDCGMNYTLSSLMLVKSVLSDEHGMAKFQQEAMRCLKVLDLIVSLLSVHKSGKGFDHDVGAACFDIVLELLKTKSNKNKVYVTEVISNIMEYQFKELEQLGSQIMEKVFVAVVRNNPVMLHNIELVKRIVIYTVSRLEELDKDDIRSVLNLNGLRALCSYNKVSIRRNQDFILEALQEKFQANAAILYPIRIGVLEKQSINYEELEPELEHEMVSVVMFEESISSQFSKKEENNSEIQINCQQSIPSSHEKTDRWLSVRKLSEQKQHFLLTQLKFLYHLCRENALAIQVLKGDPGTKSIGVQLNFDVILTALNEICWKECQPEQKYGPQLRAMTVRLLEVIYVDDGIEKSFLQNFKHPFRIEDADKNWIQIIETELTDLSRIAEIKLWIKTFFEKESEYLHRATENDCNKVVVRVLQLLSQLINYGYVCDLNYVEPLLNPILMLLEDNLRASHHHFKQPYQHGAEMSWSSERKNYFKIKEKAMKVLYLLFKFQEMKSLKNIIHDYCYLSSVEDDSINGDKEGVLLHEVTKPVGINIEQKILLHQSPIDDDMWKNRNEYAKRIIEVARDRLSEISQKNKDPVFTFCDYLSDVLLELSHHEQDGLIIGSLVLLNHLYSFESDILSTALTIQLLNTPQSLEVYDIVKKLKLQLKEYFSCEQSSLSAVQALKELCYLKNEVGEPHQINQRIIINFGIFNDVLEYTLLRCKVDQKYSVDERRKVLECLELLQGLACRNINIKSELIEHIDSFLNLASSDLATGIGLLLCEVFKEGPSITLKLRKDQVLTIFRLVLFKNREVEAETNSFLAEALLELCQVRELDIPVSHYQLLLEKWFSSLIDNENSWSTILFFGSSVNIRWQLLLSKDNSDSQLITLLILTDMFATIAYGGSSHGYKIMCSSEELTQIISYGEMELYCRRPFMKFLIWVHMNGEDIKELNLFFSKHERKLIQHLTEIIDLLKELCVQMKSLSNSSYIDIKKLLRSPSFKYCHKTATKRKNNIFIADMLLYMTEGVLPYLQVLFKYHGLQMKITECYELYKTLLALIPIFSNSERAFLTSQESRNYYRSVLVVKNYIQYSHCDSVLVLGDELQTIENSILTDSSLLQKEQISMARKKYNETYQHEIKLNADFRKYVLNYKAAYEGRNTRADQIVLKSASMGHEAYSEFLDEERIKPGPRFLPLGNSFQQHVKLFRSDESNQFSTKSHKECLIKQLRISKHRKKETLLSNSVHDKVMRNLDIKSLQILRATIYNELVQLDHEEKERSPESYTKIYEETKQQMKLKKCELNIHPLQNEILDLDDSLSVISSLLSHSDERIMTEGLALIELILNCASHKTLEQISDHLENEEHNLFAALQGLLCQTIATFQERKNITRLLENRNTDDQKLLLVTSQPHDRTILNTTTAASTNRARNRLRISVPFRLKPSLKSLLLDESNNRISLLTLHQVSSRTSLLTPPPLKYLISYEYSMVMHVSRILGHLCSGQFTQMQDFLRDQGDSIQSINMVGELTSFLVNIFNSKDFGTDMLKMCIQVLQSLTEICIGNFKNCETIHDRNLVFLLNSLLRVDILAIGDVRTDSFATSDIFGTNVRKNGLLLKASVVELLEVMVLKTTQEADALIKRIYLGLDIRAIHLCMADFYAARKDKDFVKMEVDDNACRALFSAYNVCMYIADTKVCSRESLEPAEPELRRVWNFCASQSRSIEVLYRAHDNSKEILTKTHFNVHAEMKIDQIAKEYIIYRLDRFNPGEKLKDFQNWTSSIIKYHQHMERISQSKLHMLTRLSTLRFWMLLILTVGLNIIVAATYQIPTNIRVPTYPNLSMPAATYPTPSNRVPTYPNLSMPVKIAIYVGGSLHLFLSVWMMLEHFILVGPFLFLPSWFNKLLQLMTRSLQKIKLCRKISETRVLQKNKLSYFNVLGYESVLTITFVISSILSLVFQGFFYSICLFYVIVLSDILQRALQSVTKNFTSLILVGILLLIATYVYAIIAFTLFPNDFESASNFYCQTLEECFISILRFGWIDSFLCVPTSGPQNSRYRLLYDVTFFIFVTTVGFNIVFGIILDAFSQLREERVTIWIIRTKKIDIDVADKSRAKEDMKTVCFICSLPSYEFDELYTNCFRDHIKRDHNMWNYVYYLMYLEKVGIKYKPFGKYVRKKIQEKSIDFYPFHKALVLANEEDKEELRQEFQDLEAALGTRFSHLEQKFENLEKTLSNRETGQ